MDGKGYVVCTLCHEEDKKVENAGNTIMALSDGGEEERLYLCQKHEDSFPRYKFIRRIFGVEE